MTFGSLSANNLTGKYYILVEGIHLGASSYNGNITLTGTDIVNTQSEVPIPPSLPFNGGRLGIIWFDDTSQKYLIPLSLV